MVVLMSDRINGIACSAMLFSQIVLSWIGQFESQKQDIYSVGKLLESLASLCQSPTDDLMRISVQACAKENNVQFRSPKAMFDILLLRH